MVGRGLGPQRGLRVVPPPAVPQGHQSLLASTFPPSHAPRPHVAGGGLGGQRIRCWTSPGSLGLSGWGKCWLCSLLILRSQEGLPPFPLISSPWVGPSRVGTPHLPQLPLRGTSPHLASTFPPSPSHAPRTHAARGALRGQKIKPWTSADSIGPSGQGKHWLCSLPIL